MKLASNFKPHLIASKDDCRYILQHVCLRHGMAIATNGRSMVAAINEEWGSEVKDPEEALIPLEASKAATRKRKKADGLYQNVIEISEGQMTVPDIGVKTVFTSPSHDIGKYPNILKVLPEHKAPVSITFDAKLLKELSDAMGETQICLTFDQNDLGKCMIVTASKRDDRLGLLMPIRFGERGDGDLSKNEALERLRKLAKKSETTTNP